MNWVLIHVVILSALAIDTLYHTKSREGGSFRFNLFIFSTWVSLALLFNFGIYLFYGLTPAIEFLSVYTIESLLSLDNVFIFYFVFKMLHIPPALQRRVLFYGVLGAMVFRILFILLGYSLLSKFEGLYILLGLILITQGAMSLASHKSKDASSGVFKWIKKLLDKSSPEDKKDKFFYKQGGKIHISRLFYALLAIEGADIIFAIDSIPASLALSKDLFIIYSANLLAILTLRSLYILARKSIEKLPHLERTINFILILVGLKMILSPLFEVPTYFMLIVIVLILLIGLFGQHKKSRGY